LWESNKSSSKGECCLKVARLLEFGMQFVQTCPLLIIVLENETKKISMKKKHKMKDHFEKNLIEYYFPS
jgi:hypothetical protein